MGHSWMDMVGNYKTRMVDRYEEGDLVVSTVRVTDGARPFETAIAHPSYDYGELIVVEAYDTKEQGQQGHDRWVKIMTSNKLPDGLADCCYSQIAQFAEKFSGPLVYLKEKK